MKPDSTKTVEAVIQDFLQVNAGHNEKPSSGNAEGAIQRFEQAKAALSTGVPFRFIGFDAQRYTPAQLKVLAVQTQPFGIGVALNVYDGQLFQSCLDAGVNAAASWFFTPSCVFCSRWYASSTAPSAESASSSST